MKKPVDSCHLLARGVSSVHRANEGRDEVLSEHSTRNMLPVWPPRHYVPPNIATMSFARAVSASLSSSPRELTLEEIEDAQDLRSVIATGLAAPTVDQQSLRQAVWTYVGAERDVGARPGRVVVTLTEIVEASPAPRSVRDELTRQVILWCVEAYFGHLGGEGMERGTPAAREASPAKPRIVSNR